MDIISHAQVMPWPVDAGFLLQMILQAFRAIGLLALFGLAYAGARRLLISPHSDRVARADHRALFIPFRREEVSDET